MAVKRRDMGDGTVSVSVPREGGLAEFVGAWRSLTTGMRITAQRSLEKRGTLRYPFEKLTMPPRWRGALRLRGMMGFDDVAVLTDAPPQYNKVLADLMSADRLPPCVGTCPANVDARGQNYLISDGKVAEAYELVRQRNILPGALGRICHHPCEAVCTRSRYDESIAIRPLHRFAQEQYSDVRMERVKPLVQTQGMKVAIIGSGPSGLAAALDLMRLGYSVTSFEKDETPGGALNTGVPVYRLPRQVLYDEIDDLVRMGLNLRLGVEIGVDVTLADLRRDFDAVLVAVGLRLSRILPIPGSDAEGILGAVDFLRKANFTGEADMRGKSVLVIGGGNVAVDCARMALRCGASQVRFTSLESETELPAHPWEIEEALDEGIIATCSVGPDEVLVEDGHVAGLRVRECLSFFDPETHRPAPKFGDTLSDIACDVIIFSIGQAAVLQPIVKDSDVELNERGQLVTDRGVYTTSGEGVFACGEVVTGPGACIGAIATGHEAAASIHRFLQGVDLSEDRIARPEATFEKYAPFPLAGVEAERRRPPEALRDADERRKDFAVIEQAFSDAEALHDAQRCLRCASEICVGCTFCARTCPDNCIVVERDDTPGARAVTRYDYDMTKCCFCGLCAEQCPTDALTHTGQYELSFYHRELGQFDRGEMLRDPSPTRATGRDGLELATTSGPAGGERL